MISSEVSIVITTYTSYLEVAYLQKIVLYCSTFLYHELSCETWKIYYTVFHALGWLSGRWFTSSVCKQWFSLLPVKETKSSFHLWIWDGCSGQCISELGVLAGCRFVVHFVMSLQLSGFLKRIRGHRICNSTSRFPWEDCSGKEWAYSQTSPPSRAIKISSSAVNMFWF